MVSKFRPVVPNLRRSSNQSVSCQCFVVKSLITDIRSNVKGDKKLRPHTDFMSEITSLRAQRHVVESLTVGFTL